MLNYSYLEDARIYKENDGYYMRLKYRCLEEGIVYEVEFPKVQIPDSLMRLPTICTECFAKSLPVKNQFIPISEKLHLFPSNTDLSSEPETVICRKV